MYNKKPRTTYIHWLHNMTLDLFLHEISHCILSLNKRDLINIITTFTKAKQQVYVTISSSKK